MDKTSNVNQRPQAAREQAIGHPSEAPAQSSANISDKVGVLGVLSVIWLLPAGLVCLGLLGVCKALDWPPAVALIGLLHVASKLPQPLSALRWATLPASVIGALLYVLS